MTEPIPEQVARIIAQILEVDPSSVDRSSSAVSLPAWDSLKHMNIVIAMEQEFSVQFNDAEIPKLTSVAAIIESLESFAA